MNKLFFIWIKSFKKEKKENIFSSDKDNPKEVPGLGFPNISFRPKDEGMSSDKTTDPWKMGDER